MRQCGLYTAIPLQTSEREVWLEKRMLEDPPWCSSRASSEGF